MSASSDSFERLSPQTAKAPSSAMRVGTPGCTGNRICKQSDLQAVLVAADRSWAEEGLTSCPVSIAAHD
jgi:hypothetical protein